MTTRSHSARADHPEKLAQHAIGLLEAHLRDQYGMRARIGVELEWYLKLPADAPALQAHAAHYDPLGFGDQKKQYQPYAESRWISHGYREDGEERADVDGVLRQYEMVSDHRHSMPLKQLPRAVNALRQELLQHGDRPAQTRGRSSIDGVARRRTQQRDWYAENRAEIRFDTQHNATDPSGMHLNLDLVDDKSGELLLRTFDPRCTSLQRSTQRWFLQEKALFTAHPGQQARWDNRLQQGMPPVEVRAVVPESGPSMARESYLENKIVGADANPYYAVLVQLAALSDELVREQGGKPSYSLNELLDRLEPDLGARFTAAVAAHPECSYVHAPETGKAGRA